MREIVLDTETTGLDPASGHRIVEIGCVELVNHLPTGEIYHQLINPERSMPRAAFEVHGLSDELLGRQPVFADIANAFLGFIGDAPLIIHNAKFDLGFINAELAQLGRATLGPERAIDTVALAREKYPGMQASLDALCRRFNIDLSARVKHGALLDAELLAEVYLELIGGRQHGLTLAAGPDTLEAAPSAEHSAASDAATPAQRVRPPRDFPPSDAERAAHEAFIETLTDPIWRD